MAHRVYRDIVKCIHSISIALRLTNSGFNIARF